MAGRNGVIARVLPRLSPGPGDRVDRRDFWLTVLCCALIYLIAYVAGFLLPKPVHPLVALVLLAPLTRAGQGRLLDVGADSRLMLAFSPAFALGQLLQAAVLIAPYKLRALNQPALGLMPACHAIAAASALLLAHYLIRPGISRR